jgi:hypothetical protein
MPIARLLRSVACPALHRGPQHASSDQLGRIQTAAWLAARQSSTAARNTLAGKNIFQLRAAVETVEAATQQQGQQQQQPQIVPLPTSDESEVLLRIRHSVSGDSSSSSDSGSCEALISLR